ncbi:DUF397 domain-containing protein [Streptomyces sp. NL15-2K]|uniref:DUF397 domain-containing protein n=1 Tax=Streptomyces sp. NL15-2K TaxID=376149 RepID=UPI000F57D3D4|nr:MULTISPECIES: DUF397 domain-containing protein [Actinomycetes]WKX09851.1 DUF397 domain-containing protein [Kutzneria buriramensis]GCB48609.1 hypothetical protein SNL152K_5935 [Streptomyces sp. NL15-2K]
MTDISTPLAESAARAWFKSSHSGGEGNECVEIADLRTRVAVRDSKILHGATLTVSPSAFAVFVEGVAKGWRGNSPS